MSTNTSIWSIFCFIIAAFLGAIGQYLYKTGAEGTDARWQSYLLNPSLVIGIICYIGVMVLFVTAFKIGGSLTVLYPIYASTFIWAALLSWRVYGTPITATNVFGMLLLIAGMYFMGRQG